MNDTVIEAKNLSKRYGDVIAVDRVSFSIAPGEIFGLLGPNGAGKTTTILMLLGLTEISGGQARVLGHDPVREPLAVKRRVGYLPDAVGFYDYLTAADNLHYTGRLMGFSSGERKQRIADALERVGLPSVAEKRVGGFFARHAPAAGPRRDHHEGRARRHSRRADKRPRSASEHRASRL